MKGNLQLIFNEDKTTASITFTPAEEGEEWTENRIKALLEAEGVREGIQAESIAKAAMEIATAKEKVTFTVAESEAPVSKSDGNPEWKTLEIPQELMHDSERILKVAFTPEITRNIEKKIKVKKKVSKKSKLPFGKPREEYVTVIEKKIVKEPVEVDPEIVMTGWADAGDILAELSGPVEGKPGISVLGEQLEPGNTNFYTGKGVRSDGKELIAEYSGFIRRGKNWIEIIPFKHQAWTVSLSKDKSTPLLKIAPDARDLPVPSTESIVAKAVALGIPEDKIINRSLITRIVKETISSGSILEDFPLTGDQDASFSITTSEDKIKGFLNMKKGSGNGKALKLNEVGEAIKKSGFAGLDYQKIKEDILAFHKSTSMEMKNYVLAEGKLPEMGEETTFSVECEMLKPKELETHKKEIEEDYTKRKPQGIESLDDYPVAECKNIAPVSKEEVVGIFSPSSPGAAGKDVYGKVLPGLPGESPDLVILENLSRQKDSLISEIDGYLDLFEDEGSRILRVRPLKTEIFEIEISDDKMEAFLSIAENGGEPITPDEVKEKLISEGVVKGLNEETLLAAVEASNSGEPVNHILIASGEAPVEPGVSRLKMNIRVSENSAVTLRSDGSADFKNQDRITSVAKGDLIGTILSPQNEARNGWDVCGKTLEAKDAPELNIEIGNGIEKKEEENGDISLTATTSGELIQEDTRIFINDFHLVKGDVDLKEGNIKFPGSVKIGGSVTQGFFVMSGGEVQIAGGVEASLVSAGESIIIGQGVVGGGKAVLRSKKDIELAFAEQATLLAVGNIKAKNSCLRCRIKCNGKVLLVGDKGNLIGGDTKTTGGIDVNNLGNDKGVKTTVSFGQNYLIQDRIELEEKEIEKIKNQLSKLDLTMHQLEKEKDSGRLKTARLQKVKLMKIMEKRGVRLFTLRERFEGHFPSEIKIRGTLYPGVILESHGRYHEITNEKKNLIITFDLQTGKIEETPIKKEN